MKCEGNPREFQHELVVVDKVVRRTYCMKDKFAGRWDQEINPGSFNMS